MKARVKDFQLEATYMTKYEYNDKIKKIQLQHPENKRINGYYCNWNGYRFWILDKDFNKLYTIENDKEV